jgi:chromosomal replication initiator protein
LGARSETSARTCGEASTGAIQQALAERIGPQKYGLWFENSTKLELTGRYLKIGVPNMFIAGWIENHFSSQINQAVQEVTGAGARITFTVAPELSGYERPMQLESLAQLAAETRNRLKSSSTLTFAARSRSSEVRAGGKTAKTSKRLAWPPSKAGRGRMRLTLDTFVVGPSNELAYNAARAVIKEQQSSLGPLFIHGRYGAGKTHLLRGICDELSKQRPETDWLYLSAEDFANQFILALKTKKLDAFRRRMRKTSFLAIDDAHFLANKPSTQEEFLHTFDTISLASKRVVLVSDAHPKMIAKLSEKLVSRFLSGVVVKMELPDFQTRCEICRQFALRAMSDGKFAAAGIPESVIKYIAKNLPDNVRELEGALLKLIAYSALENVRVTLPMARTVLTGHLERCDPIVHISHIESAVATYFGITPASINSSRKHRTIALARHFSMYLTRKHTRISSSEIGRFMGNKDHATVFLACKKIEALVKRNADLHWQGPGSNPPRRTKARTVLDHLERSIAG